MKGLPNLRLLTFCNVTNFKIFFLKEVEMQVYQLHTSAAKTVAWVQHLFLHYLFTYTYLFSLNIMSSNLLSVCNKDDKLRDHQQLFFEFVSRICMLIYPPSLNLLAGFVCSYIPPPPPSRQRFPFQIFSIFLTI